MNGMEQQKESRASLSGLDDSDFISCPFVVIGTDCFAHTLNEIIVMIEFSGRVIMTANSRDEMR
jgi:hypothetical protein